MAKNREQMPVSRSGEGSFGPFQQISRLHNQIDRLFEDFFPTGPVASSLWDRDLWGSAGFNPPCDIQEKEDHYLLSLDLPGVKKEDIKVDMQGNQLVISGERKQEREEDEKGRHYAERSYGFFRRALTLPTGVKAEDIEADFADGVLSVAIPKMESQSSQSVRIGEGKGGFLKRLMGKKEQEKPEGQKRPSTAA